MNQPLNIDVVVITALSEEKQALKSCFGIDFETVVKHGIHYNVGTIKYKDRAINVATVQPIDMGPIPAAVIATRSIIEWQPFIIAMTGICAGMKSLTKMGDIIVASQVFDHTAGTYKNGSITPFQQSIGQDQWVLQFIQSIMDNEKEIEEISSSHPRPAKDHGKTNIHIGPMASGSFVVKDSSYMESLLDKTSKLYGIDMESYGVASAAKICSSAFDNVVWLVTKGVADHADNKKKDDWHSYCAFASAKFLMIMLNEILKRDNSYAWLENQRKAQIPENQPHLFDK